ncbi:MAG: hypothetical protein ACOC0P_01475, partial [Planctomycetota bacterium]
GNGDEESGRPSAVSGSSGSSDGSLWADDAQAGESERSAAESLDPSTREEINQRLAKTPDELSSGSFLVQPGWFTHEDGLEVMAILATKPEWVTTKQGGRRRKKKRSPRSRSGPLASSLRLFEHGTNAVQYQLRNRLKTLEEDLLRERFRRWSQHQTAMRRLQAEHRQAQAWHQQLRETEQRLNHSSHKASADLEAAKAEAERLKQQLASSQQAIDAAKAEASRSLSDAQRLEQDLTRIQADLARAEAERQRVVEAIPEKLDALATEMSQTRNAALQALREEIAATRAQLHAAESERDRLRADLARQFEGRLERRCLEVESRVYDVEDAVQALRKTGEAAD